MDAFMEEFQHLKIPFEDIQVATNNFDDKNLIGSGGFGSVYRGEITHSKGRNIVAFKRLDPRYGQGNLEFWKEIMMLSQYKHENIVSLLGFCDEGGEKILVYEYASRGSLDHHLCQISLKWIQRLKICLEVARALQYLHDPKGTQQRVLHRDLKSSNILLDKNWTAKISDFGLSKLGPANQHHTVLISHALGTPGYCDPLYMELGFLTKESDIYSLGVVFFELLCGRLCFEYHHGQCQIIVPMWQKSYEQKKLDEIIFQGMMKLQMDPKSLGIFSRIAYQCLSKSRVDRPTISHVVKHLEISLKFQEIYEVIKQPNEYEEKIRAAIPPLIYGSVDELRMFLSKGIYQNKGKMNGEHWEMISARECLIPTASESINRYSHANNSRFGDGCYLAFDGKFKTHVKTQLLLPQTTYTINLVFRLIYKKTALSKPIFSPLKYKLEGEAKPLISYFADEREDGSLMAELYQFTSANKSVDLKIVFEGSYSLAVEGIEFRTVKKVNHELLKDEKMDMQPKSNLEINWEQKLPNNYEEIIKRSKNSVQWTTTKELFFILYKGFQINDGKEWVSLDGNGKKCHMLSARKVLLEQQWSWESLPESRFEEVAVHPNKRFNIMCKTKFEMLSSQTTYASYLVYKLPKNPYEFEAPVILNHITGSWFISLLSPRTPSLRRTMGRNTRNPFNGLKMCRFPRIRHDGWMEVPLWQFVTGVTPNVISVRVELMACSRYKVIEGLTVQGIEFKPLCI